MSTRFRRLFAASLILACTTGLPVHAASSSLEEMLGYVEQRINDPEARDKAIEAGQERALLCNYCHGEDGNSLKPDVPNLAGQNAGYLLDQIDKFADGRRKDMVMNSLAENFSPEDKVNLAIFYASMAVAPRPVDAALAAKGKALFTSVCANCHGADGKGSEHFARLAGQRMEYLKGVLTNFHANANSDVSKIKSHRRSQTMEGVVKDLSPAQIEAVAAYAAQLQ